MRLHVLALLAALAPPGVAMPQSPLLSSTTSSGLHAIDPQNPRELRELFRRTEDPLPVVSAHRGGPQPGFPENCLATFEDTLKHAFSIIEMDPRYTRDGAIVVLHDATLERTTTGEGRVADHTVEELKRLRLKDTDGAVTPFQIPTLDEVLQWARGKTILVIDQKDIPIKARVAKIEQHRAEAYAMLIVYSFKDAQACYELNKNIMMEVMIPNREKFHEFDKTGIPWSNVVAFVGHTPPQDMEVLRLLHAKGVCCISGTSRNLDREFAGDGAGGAPAIQREYRDLLQSGVDLIETDLPREVGYMLYGESTVPASKTRFFERP